MNISSITKVKKCLIDSEIAIDKNKTLSEKGEELKRLIKLCRETLEEIRTESSFNVDILANVFQEFKEVLENKVTNIYVQESKIEVYFNIILPFNDFNSKYAKNLFKDEKFLFSSYKRIYCRNNHVSAIFPLGKNTDKEYLVNCILDFHDKFNLFYEKVKNYNNEHEELYKKTANVFNLAIQDNNVSIRKEKQQIIIESPLHKTKLFLNKIKQWGSDYYEVKLEENGISHYSVPATTLKRWIAN